MYWNIKWLDFSILFGLSAGNYYLKQCSAYQVILIYIIQENKYDLDQEFTFHQTNMAFD